MEYNTSVYSTKTPSLIYGLGVFVYKIFLSFCFSFKFITVIYLEKLQIKDFLDT